MAMAAMCCRAIPMWCRWTARTGPAIRSSREVRDGKLYGRGACDMKGFVGVALSLAPEIAKAKLKRPIHFALSYDEEVGCVGVTGLLDDLKDAEHQAGAGDRRRADADEDRGRAQGRRQAGHHAATAGKPFQRARKKAPMP